MLAAARARLANEAFISKAPPSVVDGARARAAELEELVERLRWAARQRGPAGRPHSDRDVDRRRPERERTGA